jgi:hypothetical protein
LQFGKAERVDDKDAADVLRLMQTTNPTTVGETLSRLKQDATPGEVTTAAITYISTIFGRRGAPGIEMATRATRLALPADRVDAICLAYSDALTAAAG